jgi:hypothetical protein
MKIKEHDVNGATIFELKQGSFITREGAELGYKKPGFYFDDENGKKIGFYLSKEQAADSYFLRYGAYNGTNV